MCEEEKCKKMLLRFMEVPGWWTERDCAQMTAALTKVFDALYTRDSTYPNGLVAVTDPA
jgi:hypothetical protein